MAPSPSLTMTRIAGRPQTPFSEKPLALRSLLETAFYAHQTTRDDCPQVQTSLSTAEE